MTELPYERWLREWMEARGMNWRPLRYRTASGEETRALRLAPANPPRGVVLLVHGAGNDALFSFPATIKRLLDRGFEVFTFDLDGHGRSNETRFDPDRADLMVPAAVRQVAAAERGLPLHLLGVSLGGALALHALGHAPEQYTSAVLIAAPLRILLGIRSLLAELGPRTARALWREREHSGIWGAVPSFGPVKRAVYPLRLAVPPGPGPFGYVDVLNAALRRLDLRDSARRVRAPTLLVYGDRDRIVPLEQGEELAELIPSARLLRVRGETHLSVPSAHEAVAGTVGWLEAYAGAAA